MRPPDSFAIKAGQLRRDARGLFVAWVVRFEQLDRFLLDVGQRGRNTSQSHGLIHGSLRELKCVSRAVMTIDTLHLMAR